MSKKKNSSILCFSVSKTDSHIYDELLVEPKHTQSNFSSVGNFAPINNVMSISMNEKQMISPGDCRVVANGNNSCRPLPPPYNEYKQQTQLNLKRSFSSYSTCNEKGLFYSSSYKDGLSDDGFSQYSEGDPPKLIDESNVHQIIFPSHNSIIRPNCLRPGSPGKLWISANNSKLTTKLSNSFYNYPDKTTESPGADSGVRLTPNDYEYFKLKKLPHDLNSDELKQLKIKNNGIAAKEISNQNLMNRASYFIERLRFKLKEKNQEIANLQNRLSENTEKIRIKNLECRTLQLELDDQMKQNKQQLSGLTHDIGCQVDLSLTKSDVLSYDRLIIQHEDERTKWLEEKSNVINYHKQLNRKYQALLDHNRQLENELLLLQQKLMFTNEEFDEEDHEADLRGANGNQLDSQSQSINDDNNQHSTYNTVSRVVKLEESLC